MTLQLLVTLITQTNRISSHYCITPLQLVLVKSCNACCESLCSTGRSSPSPTSQVGVVCLYHHCYSPMTCVHCFQHASGGRSTIGITLCPLVWRLAWHRSHFCQSLPCRVIGNAAEQREVAGGERSLAPKPTDVGRGSP